MPRTQSQGRGNYRTRAYCSCFVQVCSLKVIGFFDRFDVGISFGDPELVYFGSFRVSGSMLDDERYTRMQYSLPPSFQAHSLLLEKKISYFFDLTSGLKTGAKLQYYIFKLPCGVWTSNLSIHKHVIGMHIHTFTQGEATHIRTHRLRNLIW